MRFATMLRARPMISQIQIPQIRNTLIFIFIPHILCHDHAHDHDLYDYRINYTPAADAAPKVHP